MTRIEIGEVAIEAFTAGNGPPLLFLHGGDYVAQNRPFLDRLAQRFRVIAPRHPGFGRSPRPNWFRTVHDIAYLYLDLLDRLDLDEIAARRLVLRRLDRARNGGALVARGSGIWC